ncbi:MAG: hypothetical protein QMC60_06795 [Amylibacter sp.]|jgi:hypothetical protein
MSIYVESGKYFFELLVTFLTAVVVCRESGIFFAFDHIALDQFF